MKIPSYRFRRLGVECVSTIGSRHRGGSFITKRRAAIAATVCLGWLPAFCAAQEIVPEPDASSALRSVSWSPEGKPLLVVTLALFVALFLMERLCDWRLRGRRRRAQTASQALQKALPHALSPLSVTPRWPVESSRVRFLAILAAWGAFQITSSTMSAQTIYVANGDFNSGVGAYDAATGVPVAGFVPPSYTYGASNVAVAGNTLYVAGDKLQAYNATTGAPLAGFNAPASTNNLQGLTVVGNTLYASDMGGDSVNAYNATTGALLPGFSISGGNIHEPADIAVTGSVLYLARGGDGLIGTYNALTGAPINASFISLVSANRFPFGLALSGNMLYVSDFNGSTVSEYNAITGALINGSFISGLQRPTGLALSGNTLYVTNSSGNSVGAYDATTGAAVADFVSPSGLDNPFGVAVAGVPEPGSCVLLASCVAAGAVWRRQRRSVARVG